jgi:hypothetical protein
MADAGWVFDDARFDEEVLRPVSQGWNPTENVFRCYLLAPDVTNLDVIQTALDGVLPGINNGLRKVHYEGAARLLKRRHDAARALLEDKVRRERHRAEVVAALRRLRGVVERELGDLRWAPPSFVDALADRLRGAHTRREISAVLAELGRPVREPATLPGPSEPPRTYREVREALGLLDQPSLRGYLVARLGSLSPADADLERRRLALRTTASGETLTAEQKIIERLRRWIRAGELTDVLRAELRADLARRAQLGFAATRAFAAEPSVAGQLATLGLPADADELAYAAVVAARSDGDRPASASWQTAFEEALARRDPRGALAALETQAQLLPAQEQQRDRLRAQLREIDDRLATARALESRDPEAALAVYEQVAKVSDEPEVEQAFRRCRPAAPSTVQATAANDRVVVRWSPSDARIGTITYRILRAAGRRPTWADGTEVAAGVAETEVIDVGPPGGQPLHYAVFTLRDNNPSASPAVTGGALVMAPDVTALEVRGGEGVLEGSWRLAEGASAARVTRTRPGGRPEPVAAGPTGFRDEAVDADVRYLYEVRAEYRLADGSAIHSRGVTATGRTHARPAPVRDLVVTLEDSTVSATWTPPARGTVELRLCDRAPGQDDGAVVSLLSLRSLGARLVGDGPLTPGELRAAVPAAGRTQWLVPLTVVEDTAVVGTARRLDARLSPVRNLAARRLGGNLVRLTWHWPGLAAEVLVGWKAGAPPSGPNDPDASFRRFTRALYEQDGADIALPAGDHTFLVCATAYVAGRQVYGPPAVVREGVRRRARYDVRPVGRRQALRGRLGRTYVLTVESLDGTSPPGVQLVARSRLVPLDPADGDLVVTITGGAEPTGRVEREFDLDRFRDAQRPLLLRAFPAGEAPGAIELEAADPRNLEIR